MKKRNLWIYESLPGTAIVRGLRSYYWSQPGERVFTGQDLSELTEDWRHVTLRIQHHDRASLLAGKLHALLQRCNVKGRDLYDLMWLWNFV